MRESVCSGGKPLAIVVVGVLRRMFAVGGTHSVVNSQKGALSTLAPTAPESVAISDTQNLRFR